MLGEGDTDSRAHRWNAFITFFLLKAQSLWCHDPWLHLSSLFWPCLRFFPLCPKELFLSLYFKSWIWHSITHSLVWMGRWLLNADEGQLLNLILFGWFLCLFLRAGSYACLLAYFLLLHTVKIFWMGLGPCVILTSINVVKMSCVSRVSSHMTFTMVVIYHGNGYTKKHLSSLMAIQSSCAFWCQYFSIGLPS